MNTSLRNSIHYTPSIGTTYPVGKPDTEIKVAPNTKTHNLSGSADSYLLSKKDVFQYWRGWYTG
jgi:hypothetical protein